MGRRWNSGFSVCYDCFAFSGFGLLEWRYMDGCHDIWSQGVVMDLNWIYIEGEKPRL